MSDRPPQADTVPNHADKSMRDPEIEDLEREKLRAEVRKLKVDNSLANRLFTTILSGAAVAIAVSQIWMASQQRAADNARASQQRAVDDARAKNDETLKEIDLHIKQVESGLKLSQFAIDQRTLFLAASADEQVRAVRLVQALLPRLEAGLMLDAMGKVATQAEVLSEVETGQRQLANAAPPQSRPTVPSTVPPPQVAQPTTTLSTPATPQPSQPGVSSAPVAISGLPLTIYYHVQRAEDRELASAVAGSLTPQHFPSAGIQLIPQGPSAAQVRYYKPAQKAAAQALAQMLTQQLETLTGKEVAFKSVDISATYPNLPSDRMEVWFAPSMPLMKPS
jgi:hypothetical protein